MYSIIGGDQREYGPVSGDEVRQWIAEGRASAQTLARIEGGPWKPLSAFPEFAGALGGPPGTTPPPIAAPLPPPAPRSSNPRQRVQGPAVYLIVVSGLSVALCALYLILHLVGSTFARPQSTGNPEVDRVLELFSGGLGVAYYLLGIAINGFIILGSCRMLKLRNYGLCMAAGIAALVPCVTLCCCLGLPGGIWALVVLSRPEVKAAFESALR